MKIVLNELERVGKIFDRHLKNYMDGLELDYIDILEESMNYSLFTGGKRLRPVFTIKSFELFSNDLEKVMPYAMAIEMIHTYSLIHDDLPSMDDDDYRRGKKTNHIVYGEDIAILAGDGLLNLAFETIADHIDENCNTKEEYIRNVKALKELSKYSGIRGMIGGQVIDIKASKENMDGDKLVHMYKCKTAGLFQAGITSAALVGGATEEEVEILREFALNLGLSYQIQDDILDKDEDKEIGKLTYLSFYDKDKALMDINTYTDKAIEKLAELENRDTKFLRDLTYKLVNREV